MRVLATLALVGLSATPALAQMAVIDNANLAQAHQVASNTQAILRADQSIMRYTQQTLQAVTGNRSSLAQGELARMALGGGFSMGAAPSLSAVIAGGPLTFTGMSAGSQTVISNLINGLQLVKTITGLLGGPPHPVDQAYRNAVNVTSTLTGLINATQGAVQKRSQAFTAGGQAIGSAPDLKGSIDQNSQIQLQTGQTINEMTGVVNNAVTATNQANLDRIAQESAVARAMRFQ